MVINCPCALVISVPLSFFAAIGGAGKAGILVKGSSYLETLSQVSEIVFDKTGTVTKGVFELKKIVPLEISESELLELAAHVEAFSDHPISRSIIKAYGKTPDENRIGELENIPGKGIVAKIDSEIVAVGNSRSWMLWALSMRTSRSMEPLSTRQKTANIWDICSYLMNLDPI